MVRVITVDDVKDLIYKVSLEKFIIALIDKLKECFSHWTEFHKMPRMVTHFSDGVIELMPLWGRDYYTVKYINGHPLNPKENKQTVIGTGFLADIATGYPVIISEMTILTALRTAATSALASEYLAKKDSKTFAIIGTGAQSEFQVLAHRALFPIETVTYFDLDAKAMDKFASNLKDYDFHLKPCQSVEEAVHDADIITTATAAKKQAHILENGWIKPGVMINAIGGDCQGKTELDPEILKRGNIVVEFIDQAQYEGEVQNYDPRSIYAELWELIKREKPGRTSDQDIFIFDSVGFALEDYAVLRLVSSLSEDFHIGHMMDMIPDIEDPKNLFGALRKEH
jgi:ornithine cyclodeaminase